MFRIMNAGNESLRKALDHPGRGVCVDGVWRPPSHHTFGRGVLGPANWWRRRPDQWWDTQSWSTESWSTESWSEAAAQPAAAADPWRAAEW